MIKSKMSYFPVPPDEQWRVGFLTELLSNELFIPGFDEEETSAMVAYLCNN